MPVTNEVVREILKTLDHKNDALWTDDGAPLISEIQRLSNDKDVSRAQINEAWPGFIRVTKGKSVQQPEVKDTTGTADAEDDQELDDMLGGEGGEGGVTEQESVRAISQRHVREAELALQDAKSKLTEAQRYVVTCERNFSTKLQRHASKFPPTSAAQNIKDHLARQQEILRERVTGERKPATLLNPVDATMADKSRPNGRNAASQKKQVGHFLPRKSAVNY